MRIRTRTLAFLLLTTALLSACGAAGPSSTVRKFYGYLEAADAEKAITLISSEVTGTFARPKILAALEEGIREIKAKGGIRSHRIESEEIEGDEATVRSAVDYGNGEASSDVNKLIREKDGWKLAPMK